MPFAAVVVVDSHRTENMTHQSQQGCYRAALNRAAQGPSTPQLKLLAAKAYVDSNWTQNQISQLRACSQEGDSHKVIAALLGMAKLAIEIKLEQLGASIHGFRHLPQWQQASR